MAAPPSPADPDARARAILLEVGLPEGLLPPGITKAELEAGGAFTVELPQRVERVHGGYTVRFGPRIRGQLSPGKVRGLRGVEAKQLIWLGVEAIAVEGEALVFSVGPARVRLPRAAFPWG